MDYSYYVSRDPKWTNVQPGQYAVVQCQGEGVVALVFTIESTRAEAVAYARSLNLSSALVLYRDGLEKVTVVPWEQ
jgi:hypothetical protein